MGFAADCVDVAAALPGDAEVAAFSELIDDALYGALSDADVVGEVSHADFRITGNEQQYVRVVGEECPVGFLLGVLRQLRRGGSGVGAGLLRAGWHGRFHLIKCDL